MKTNKLIYSAIIIGIIVFGLTAILSVSNIKRIGIINPWLEAVIFLFLLISVVITISMIFRHKKDVWKPSFIFFLSGIVLTILVRLMIYLFDIRFLEIGTFVLLIHFIFYFSMICFFMALGKIIKIEEKVLSGKRVGFLRSDLIILIILGILSLVFFFGAESLDSWFLSWFEGSFVDEIGLQHFIAFILTIFVSARLIWVRFFVIRESYDKKIVGALFGGFFIFLFLIGLNHFWELLTESWKILVFSESFIETVEQIFWLPASIFLFYGLWKASNIKRGGVAR